MTTLTEAREAQVEVQRLLDLKTKADQLPELERRAERDRATAQALADLDDVKEQARADLDLAKEMIDGWRERFDTAVAELEQLESELPELNKLVVGAGVRVRNAVETMAMARDPDKFRGIGVSWFAHLVEIGGVDPALALPSRNGRDLAAELMTMLCNRARVRPYHPSIGVKYFG